MSSTVRHTPSRRSRGRWWACWIALIPIILPGCRTGAPAGTPESAEETQGVTVHVMAAEQRTISQTLQTLGTCEALLSRTATLAPAVEGQVVRILAVPGDTLKAGQALVQLDPRLANANLSEKKVARDALVSSLALLRALPRPEEQKAYQLAIDDAKVGVQKAEAAVERLQPLLERHEIPAQQALDARLTLDQARLQLQKAESQYRVAMMGPQPAAIDEAQCHITAAEVAIATAENQRDLLCLRAPIDGVLDKLTCQLGQTLTVGTPVGQVVDTRELYALVWFAPHDAQLVHVGQKARFQAVDHTQPIDEGSGEFSGQVEFVGHSTDPQTGNFPVRLRFENPDQRLGIGQMMAVEIIVSEKTALAVPAEALFDLAEGPSLVVVRQGTSTVLHPHIGLKDKAWVEVTGTDLQAGEAVIVEGGWGLVEGTKVQEKQAQETSAEKESTESKETPSGKAAEGDKS